MRVRTVALLLTDVVGSTRLWRDAPESMNAAMIRHHELVAAAAAAHGGWRPVDQGEGDATFLAFDSAVDAVAAALDLQRALIAEPWPTPAPLAVRIGIHVGEVITRDGNIFGETVSRCARIRGVAHGGQTLLSTAAYELVRDSLPSRAALRSLGEHRMKDLIRPEGIWQLDHPDLPGDFPPLASLNRGRHNLPV
ncbi:MAG TPA: adenylate/guanylate cyclase domain-containing protein, partial [Mycobacteriales bacterium]|nr:adenylate/guanylate cyclase domain-containing protein [Mycobacteriales bacterium]